MDGGHPPPHVPDHVDFNGAYDRLHGSHDLCFADGYVNRWPKSIAVVQTSYKNTNHEPGSCSALHHDPYNGAMIGYHLNVPRQAGLIVQHTAEMLVPGRYSN